MKYFFLNFCFLVIFYVYDIQITGGSDGGVYCQEIESNLQIDLVSQISVLDRVGIYLFVYNASFYFGHTALRNAVYILSTAFHNVICILLKKIWKARKNVEITIFGQNNGK